MSEPAVTFKSGIARAWNTVAYTCDVQLDGSLQLMLAAVPVSRDFAAGDMVNGRKVLVAFMDPTNQADAVVVAVYV